MVDIHDPTATPTLHDPNYTLQSTINIAGLFYIRYIQLLIGITSNNYYISDEYLWSSYIPQSVIHDYTLHSNISIAKLSRTYPYTHGY